jgi:cytoskeletal protein CcmA (bactofilin family)
VSETGKNISIIDGGLTVDGTISCKGELIVKGTLKGKLDGETVVIAEEGAIFAETKVDRMTIGGRFEGTLKVARDLTILTTGACKGSIACQDMALEAGGSLSADVICVAHGRSSKGGGLLKKLVKTKD